ncbi:hypothetical protein GCM10022245_50930 [Streptomyces mayteni]
MDAGALTADEGFEQAVGRAGGDDLTGVDDAQPGAAGPARAGADLDPTARVVVADGVADQVPRHPLQQHGAPGDRRRAERGLHGEGAGRDLGRGGRHGVGRDPGEVRRPARAAGAGLAAGQQEQPVQGVLAARRGVPHVVGHGDEVVRVRPAVERDVDGGADRGQRRAQFVRGVGGEQALTVQAVLDAVQHAVDGGGQRGELVGRRGHRNPLGEVVGRQPLRGGRDGADRPQDPPGQPPAEDGGQQGHHREGDGGLGEERGERQPPQALSRVEQLVGQGGRGRHVAPRGEAHDAHPGAEVPPHQQVGQAGQDQAGGQHQGGEEEGEPAAGRQLVPGHGVTS